jgi:hypothetical protein
MRKARDRAAFEISDLAPFAAAITRSHQVPSISACGELSPGVPFLGARFGKKV